MSYRLLNCWRQVECKRRQWCYYIIISNLVTITTWKPSLFGHCRLHLSSKYVTLRGKFKQRKVYGLIQKVAYEFLFWRICRSSWILMVITKKKTIKNFPDITFVLRNFTLFHCPEACRFPLDAVNYIFFTLNCHTAKPLLLPFLWCKIWPNRAELIERCVSMFVWSVS